MSTQTAFHASILIPHDANWRMTVSLAECGVDSYGTESGTRGRSRRDESGLISIKLQVAALA
jgi:hypothetical protein